MRLMKSSVGPFTFPIFWWLTLVAVEGIVVTALAWRKNGPLVNYDGMELYTDAHGRVVPEWQALMPLGSSRT